MDEYWKRIPGCKFDYEINMCGEIRLFNRIIKQHFDKKGYSHVSVSMKSGQSRKSVHQLMAITWLHHVPCGLKIVVDHIDGNPSNNKLDNLRLVTHAFNIARNREYRSMYKNVHRCKITGLWSAWVMIGLNYYSDEDFETEAEAYDAYLGLLDDNKTDKEKRFYSIIAHNNC